MIHPKNKDDALKWNYKFWNNQPVSKLNEIVTRDSRINTEININQVPFVLPNEFEWIKPTIDELVTFLDKYYAEDSDGEFRLHYSTNLLDFMYSGDHIFLGVKIKTNNLLVASICGKITKMQVNRNLLDLIEVNLLCIHPKLRSKRLTPVLIQELSRQFNLIGHSDAIYTSSNYLPTPFMSSKYYHKIINAKVLYDTKFIKLDKNTKIKNVKKTHQLPEKFQNKNFKKIEPRHLDQMFDLFNLYMEKYNLHPIFTKDEFKEKFSNKLITCYVLESDEGDVLDFVSYYLMQSRVLKSCEKHEFIRRACLYYYTSVNATPFSLISDLLIVAKNNDIHVFDALDIMENANVISELGFDEGTGFLHYYLYNWKVKPLKNIQCSWVMI